MEIYNPKEWIRAVFSISKTDTIKKIVPIMLITIVYSLGIAYLELHVLKLHLENVNWLKNIPILHSLLGVVISLLLVFRTNTAYDRWWEGRKLWGELVNNSRNLAFKLDAMLDDKNSHSRIFFRKIIPLYARCLKNHLMSEKTRKMLDQATFDQIQTKIDFNKHVPNQVANTMVAHISHLYKTQKLTTEQWLILNNELSSFTNICGACERIKNTPIPYSYSSFIKRFIILYVFTLPIGYVFSLGYWVALIVTLIMFVLVSLELIAEEIEDPFGTDENDLPLDLIASNIKKHIEEIL